MSDIDSRVAWVVNWARRITDRASPPANLRTLDELDRAVADLRDVVEQRAREVMTPQEWLREGS